MAVLAGRGRKGGWGRGGSSFNDIKKGWFFFTYSVQYIIRNNTHHPDFSIVFLQNYP
jgi:hypothetical protein